MIRVWRLVAALGGLCSVAAGAAAAHWADPHDAELLRTGALYGMVHAAALLAVTMPATRGPALAAAGWLFAAGIVLFSFSLFALALTHITALAAVTPFGGVALMLGWAAVGATALRRGGAA